ncbi:MAG: hypothetical protein ABSF98_28975 [Bryobacteraceae bacterium]
MLFRRLLFVLSLTILLQQLVAAQTLAQPRVPEDPLELVAGEAQPVQNADQRAAAVNLLARAHALSNVRAQPYHLKTTLTVTGSSSSDGAWTLEDISPFGGVYRWAVQGPAYSVVNLYTGGILYSSQPSGGIPLRLAQARAAVFFNYKLVGPHSLVRTASAALNGAGLSCVLFEPNSRAQPSAGGRSWRDSEYCVDAHSGLLITWSPAPGVYVLYDYSNAITFHGRTIPGGFTITEAGRTVVAARVESVTSPASLDPALFDPSSLSQTGVGSLMTQAWHVRSFSGRANASPNATLQEVVVHGMLTPGGELTEAEVVASSSASLNQQALDLATKTQNWHGEDDAQPGTTPQAHELFFTVQFATPGT